MRLRTRIACLGAGLALVTSAVVIPTVNDSSAAFTDAEHARVSVQASTLAPPRARDCPLRPLPPLLSTSANLRWQAPAPAPAAYTYQWQILSPSGSVQSSGTYPASTTEHRVQASALGVAATRTFRVRAVSNNWQSPWASARVTTLIDLLGVSLIGSCSWQ